MPPQGLADPPRSPVSPHSPRVYNQSEQVYYRQGPNNNQSYAGLHSDPGQSQHRGSPGQQGNNFYRGNQNSNSAGRRYQQKPHNYHNGPVYSMNQNMGGPYWGNPQNYGDQRQFASRGPAEEKKYPRDWRGNNMYADDYRDGWAPAPEDNKPPPRRNQPGYRSSGPSSPHTEGFHSPQHGRDHKVHTVVDGMAPAEPNYMAVGSPPQTPFYFVQPCMPYYTPYNTLSMPGVGYTCTSSNSTVPCYPSFSYPPQFVYGVNILPATASWPMSYVAPPGSALGQSLGATSLRPCSTLEQGKLDTLV